MLFPQALRDRGLRKGTLQLASHHWDLDARRASWGLPGTGTKSLTSRVGSGARGVAVCVFTGVAGRLAAGSFARAHAQVVSAVASVERETLAATPRRTAMLTHRSSESARRVWGGWCCRWRPGRRSRPLRGSRLRSIAPSLSWNSELREVPTPHNRCSGDSPGWSWDPLFRPPCFP